MAHKVVIIQSFAKQYRVALFTRLYELLRSEGIALTVLYSDPTKSEMRKADNVDLPSEYGYKVAARWFAGDKLVVQNVLPFLVDADLVIGEQANKHFINHLLMVLSKLHVTKFALWGLGENLQADRLEGSEFLKRVYARNSDWFFAYTNGIAEMMAAHGVRRERITALQNSVDTKKLRLAVRDIPDENVAAEKRELGIPEGAPVGLFCGMLDPVKGLSTLLEAAQHIRIRMPNFELLLAGAGPDEHLAADAAKTNPWIHYIGPVFGERKAMAFRLSDALLMPGRCGLAILDAFAAGIPLIATTLPHHGPEMEYLEHGVNGLLLPPDVDSYANAVVEVLSDQQLLAALKAGASASAEKYSVEAMAENFRRGIVECLHNGAEKVESAAS